MMRTAKMVDTTFRGMMKNCLWTLTLISLDAGGYILGKLYRDFCFLGCIHPQIIDALKFKVQSSHAPACAKAEYSIRIWICGWFSLERNAKKFTRSAKVAPLPNLKSFKTNPYKQNLVVCNIYAPLLLKEFHMFCWIGRRRNFSGRRNSQAFFY